MPPSIFDLQYERQLARRKAQRAVMPMSVAAPRPQQRDGTGRPGWSPSAGTPALTEGRDDDAMD